MTGKGKKVAKIYRGMKKLKPGDMAIVNYPGLDYDKKRVKVSAIEGLILKGIDLGYMATFKVDGFPREFRLPVQYLQRETTK